MSRQFNSEKDLISFVIQAKLPEWQGKLFKQNADAVQVHSQGQVFFKIDRLFPNEHIESKKHRILSFESITEASFGRAANNVNRIFKNSSYTVEASDTVIDYTTAHNFDGLNFYNWFLDEWVKMALKNDANARIVCYPKEYVKEYGKPPVAFIESKDIKLVNDDELIFLSVEESIMKHDLEESSIEIKEVYDQSISLPVLKEVARNTYTPKISSKAIKAVYHYFVRGEGLHRIEQSDKIEGQEGIFYDYEFFPIKDFIMPWIDAGGEKGQLDINKSFLHPFVAFGNLALLQHSQHTAVNFTFSFPRMSEIESPCEAPGCNMGNIACETEADILLYGDVKPCRQCGGTGYTANQSPYKIYRKRYDPQGMDGANDHLKVPDVQYYTPDVSILDYSKGEWKDYLEKAETAVYISQRVTTGNVQSEGSKEIDREDMFSFLTRVGQVFYNRLRFVIQCMENYMVPSPTMVAVQIPTSYAIVSESEAFGALKDILGSNIPVMIKATQVENFISKFVSQSSPIRKFMDVLKIVDPLLYYTQLEIASFKANQVISVQDYTYHVFAYPMLQILYQRDKNLFMKETSTIIQALEAELLKKVPAPVEDLSTKYRGQE